MELDFQRILVVVAHPDDEVLGCGATISMLVSKDKEVHLLILGGITTSRFEENTNEEAWKKEVFKEETEKAAALLGITSITRTNFDDNRFDTIPILELIKAVENVKDKIRPDLIITHDFSDLNVDHRLTHQAVMTTFRPNVEYNRFRIMTFETLSSNEWQDQAMSSFHPNCYVDITKYFIKKIEAMKCYKSEIKSYPHPRSLKGIEYLARKRGMEVCVEYAEAFRIVREIL